MSRKVLAIQKILSTIATVNIALNKHFTQLIARLIASGRYNNSSEVVRADLRILDAEARPLASLTYPAGSLQHLNTISENREERRTSKASSRKRRAA